ncbi:hypothetical protein [Cypionkella sp.]|uniref:Y-family DNA polymerase n=1 Tax=Cypionkella sp. TaxID=2811411 RepID=UPI00263177B2|nr:hypothetical protein [Cypionkella sp.]
MARRLISIWFPKLASDTSRRKRPVEGAFALVLRAGNAEHLHCLNHAAEAKGLRQGMPPTDARAICPELATRPADLPGLAARCETYHVSRRVCQRRRRSIRALALIACGSPPP